MLSNFINYNLWIYDFTVNFYEISCEDAKFTKNMYKTLFIEIKKYLPFENKIFEAFQILHLMQNLFR